uniref:polysaccharide deacetylase family protein n=1 Tax=uncultured Thiodictyon sp. TaxID=1846217 RepID=UPI0025CD32DD
LAAGQPLAGPRLGDQGRNSASSSPVAPVAPLPAPLDTAILTQEPAPREAPALDLPDAHTQGQSYRVLERCWSRHALLGNAAEKHARRVQPPDVSGPSRALIEHAESTPSRRSAAVPDSIRWVDLRDPKGRVIALTFDLCEQANEQSGYDSEIVNYLREQDVQATFFAGGKWMRSHAERAKQLMADPLFEVGNHAWTHGNLRVLKGRAMREQILWTQAQYIGLRDALVDQCAATLGPDVIDRIPQLPATFRFPYGTCSSESLAELADDGLAAVQWDIVTGDPGRGQTAEAIAEKVRKSVKPGRGSIVVMHANGRGFATAKALRTMIPELQHQGYQFVTVSKLLRMGTPHTVAECYEQTRGDNTRYDTLFGRGTGED